MLNIVYEMGFNKNHNSSVFKRLTGVSKDTFRAMTNEAVRLAP